MWSVLVLRVVLIEASIPAPVTSLLPPMTKAIIIAFRIPPPRVIRGHPRPPASYRTNVD